MLLHYLFREARKASPEAGRVHREYFLDISTDSWKRGRVQDPGARGHGLSHGHGHGGGHGQSMAMAMAVAMATSSDRSCSSINAKPLKILLLTEEISQVKAHAVAVYAYQRTPAPPISMLT